MLPKLKILCSDPVLTSTDARALVTQFEYNKRRQLKKTTIVQATGNIVSETLYDNNGKVSETIDPLLNHTYYTYTADGRPLTTQLPAVGGETPTVINSYDARNYLVGTHNPMGETVGFDYDAAGRLISQRDPLLRATSFGYDQNGQRTSVTSPLAITPAQTTTFAFNARGENNFVTDSLYPANPVAFQYDPNGNRTKLINRNLGEFVSTFYDDNRPASFKTPLLKTTTTTYNRRGLPETVTEPSAQQTTYQYDDRGRLVSQSDGVAAASFTYDANGNLLTHVEGSKTITRAFDALNRLTSYSYSDSNDSANNYTLGYQYDANGNLAVLTYPGVPEGTATPELEAESSPPAVTKSGPVFQNAIQGYTGTGYLRWNKAMGGFVEWKFNVEAAGFYSLRFRYALASGNRPMRVTVNGQVAGTSLDFPATGSTWQEIVLPSQALNQGVNLVRLTATTQSGNYGPNIDHLKATPVSSRQVVYTYDSHNRLSKVTDWAGRVTIYDYDLAGRSTEVSRPGGSKRKIGYNAAGQTQTIEELNSSGGHINYFKLAYDTGGRIENEFTAPLTAAFTEPSQTMTANADNQIATFNGQTVVHDADGNMTTGPLNSSTLVTYTYDTRNRLTSVGGVTYGYDPDGNRITLTQNSQTTRFVVNPAATLSQVLVRTRPSGTKTYYVYGAGLLYDVEVSSSGTETGDRHVYHYDYRGSTVAISSQIGLVLERIEYSVYGQITRRTGTTVDTPFLFNGRYGVMTDPNALYCMRARYYNPYLKRFLNADPIGLAGGMNFYAYADGNPISYLDPFGLGAQESSAFSWLSAGFKSGYGWAYDQVHDPAAMGLGLGSQILGTGLNMFGESWGIAGLGLPFEGWAQDLLNSLGGFAKAGWYDPSSPGVQLAMVLPILISPASGGAGLTAAESGAANRAAFEAYKDSLRAQMSRPAASNPELNSLLDKLYRPNAQVGSGSTAAAVRQELATGQPVGGAFHSQKAQESITALQRWLNNNPTAAGADRAAAENVIRDMQNALNGH